MDGNVNGIHWSASGVPDPARPSLLFIHGAGGNRAAWWQQFSAFAPMHHVIAYDLPGFGQSDPLASTDWRAEMVGAATAVLAAAGARRAHVICQSLGGWTGVRLALERPDLVDRLVLCCTLAGIAHPPGLAAFASAFAQMDERGPASMGLTPAFEAEAPLMALLYREVGAFNPQQDAALAQRLFDPALLVSPDALAAIAAPVLLLSGAEDPIWPPESLTGLVPHFADARQAVIAGTGHSPYFERPTAFNAQIAEFLSLDA